MIKIAVVEDDLQAQDNFEKQLNQYKANSQAEIDVTFFNTSIRFLENYKAEYQILFFDINLPDINGMELAKRIRKIDSGVSIIFLTGLGQYAINGYEVGALDYILKPIKYSRLKKVLDKFVDKLTEVKAFITIKTTSGIVRISLSDIIYVTVEDHLLYFHTKKEEYECWDTMKNAELELPKPYFVRISKSVIVNLSYISSIDSKSLTLNNGLSLPYSHLLKNTILEQMNQLI